VEEKKKKRGVLPEARGKPEELLRRRASTVSNLVERGMGR